MKKDNKVITIIIILIILILSILLVFNKNSNIKGLKKNNIFDKDYMNDVEEYLKDKFPFKNLFNNTKVTVDKIFRKKDINNIYLGSSKYLLKKYNEPINNEKIVASLNSLYSKLNYINMNLLLVPTSISINKELLPNNAITYDESKTINYIYDNINFDSINVYDTLKEHNKDYQMYYRSDLNWTTFGAYYAYLEFAKMNNINAYDINSFNIKLLTDKFNGNLFSNTKDSLRSNDSIYQFELKNTDYDIYYKDIAKKEKSLYNLNYLKSKYQYDLFLNGNHDLIEIKNNKNHNHKELVIIKDSYANEIIPFIVNHYEKVYVIDLDYYKDSIVKFINNNKKIKDLLILYNVNELDNKLSLINIK